MDRVARESNKVHTSVLKGNIRKIIPCNEEPNALSRRLIESIWLQWKRKDDLTTKMRSIDYVFQLISFLVMRVLEIGNMQGMRRNNRWGNLSWTNFESFHMVYIRHRLWTWNKIKPFRHIMVKCWSLWFKRKFLMQNRFDWELWGKDRLPEMKREIACHTVSHLQHELPASNCEICFEKSVKDLQLWLPFAS